MYTMSWCFSLFVINFPYLKFPVSFMDRFSDQCFIVIMAFIQSCLCDLRHETVESCVRDMLDDSVDMSNDKTMIKIPL